MSEAPAESAIRLTDAGRRGAPLPSTSSGQVLRMTKTILVKSFLIIVNKPLLVNAHILPGNPIQLFSNAQLFLLKNCLSMHNLRR